MRVKKNITQLNSNAGSFQKRRSNHQQIFLKRTSRNKILKVFYFRDDKVVWAEIIGVVLVTT
jgi:hypothetical protein